MDIKGDAIEFNPTESQLLGQPEITVLPKSEAFDVVCRAFDRVVIAKRDIDSTAREFVEQTSGINVSAVPGLRVGLEVISSRQTDFAQQERQLREMSSFFIANGELH